VERALFRASIAYTSLKGRVVNARLVYAIEARNKALSTEPSNRQEPFRIPSALERLRRSPLRPPPSNKNTF